MNIYLIKKIAWASSCRICQLFLLGIIFVSLSTNVFAAGVANRVLDLYSGSSSSTPSYMTPFNGKLYFGADANDGHGRELWSYDGTTATLAADIRSGSGFSGWSNP